MGRAVQIARQAGGAEEYETMKRDRLHKLMIVTLSCVLTACSGYKRVSQGQKLYDGATVELVYTGKLKDKKAIIAAAKSAIKPAPNAKILGFRPKLLMYQLAGEPKKKGLKSWLKKQGEPPVLIGSVKPEQTARFIDAKLFNIGIFRSKTEYELIEKKHTVKVKYKCYVHNPYTIDRVKNAVQDDSIAKYISEAANKTLLAPGDDYSLDNLKKERARIDGVLKDKGYFYFNADDLLFKADTSAARHTVDLQLTMKPDVPDRALRIYTIGGVYIDPDYSLEDKPDSTQKTGFVKDSIHFSDVETRVRPAVILRSVFLKPGDRYSRKEHNMTLNRLMTLGTYKFVRVRFTPYDSLVSDRLNMLVYLTPMPKRTVRAEANLISKSNDFVGPQLNVNYRNRNALNGAELLNMTVGGSFETQISGKYRNLYSYSFNPQIELYVPRFLTPFKVNTQSMYVPKTKLTLGFSYLRRIGFFDLRSIQFAYGYKWKQNAKLEHELDPLSINLTSISNRTPEFNALLESNPFIKKSYEEQFIAGARYSFIFNEQVIPNQRNQFYCNVTTEVAGNAFTAAKLIAGEHPSEEHPSKVMGSVYSQFVRIGCDLRNYSNFKKSKVVLRLYGGLGKAYGNSSTLPYIKQFFSGGPNSVRAFPINSLGPGTNLQQNATAGLFLQQGGDIKLESNAEYRFDIFRFLKGAVFADAGNVWLIRSDPAVVSQPFSASAFYKEIAVGTGVGLRVDLSFFVLRFDLAMPLRKPWLPEKERWVLDKIDFADGSWRANNLILNVAIGYPF